MTFYYILQQAVANNIELEASWISTDAKSMVDLIFVLDRSGSIRKEQFIQVKEFIRNFLEYFSVAVLQAQVIP